MPSMTDVTLWVALGFVVVAAARDLKTRTVPDWISAGLLLWALAATGFGLSSLSWLSLLGGLGIALGVGAVLFSLNPEGIGGGDVKLLAGLGAVVGYGNVFVLLFWVAVAIGLLSLVALLRGQRDLAWVPAIALGFLVFVLLREFRHALLS